MSDLRPMVLMVCEPCRSGDLSGPLVEGCAICAVLLDDARRGISNRNRAKPMKPARSREGMVEAGAAAIHGGKGCTCRAGARGDARAVLNAAIPGLLDD